MSALITHGDNTLLVLADGGHNGVKAPLSVLVKDDVLWPEIDKGPSIEGKRARPDESDRLFLASAVFVKGD